MRASVTVSQLRVASASALQQQQEGRKRGREIGEKIGEEEGVRKETGESLCSRCGRCVNMWATGDTPIPAVTGSTM